MHRTKLNPEDQYIGSVQLATEFDLHYMTALTLLRRTDFPSVKVNNRWRVKRRDAHNYFKQRKENPDG
jgi:hypothetical protein